MKNKILFINQFYRRVVSLLSPEDQKKLRLITAGLVAMSFLELLGVVSILPFMSVAMQPEIITKNKWANMLYEFLGFNSNETFLYFLALTSIGMIVLSNVVKATSTFVITKFSNDQILKIGDRAITNYLSRDYDFYLSFNSSELTKVVMSEVSQFVNLILIPSLRILARLMVISTIMLLLLYVNALAVLAMSVVLGGVYLTLYQLTKKKLLDYGDDRVKANKQRYQVLSELSGGIKEIKIMHKERFYREEFYAPSKLLTEAQTYSTLLGEIPRYFLEVIAFGGILTVSIILIGVHGPQKAMALISLYAFAGYKLMPSVQEIFSLITKVRYAMPVLDYVEKTLSLDKRSLDSEEDVEKIPFHNEISIKDLCYKYSGNERLVLDNINLSIKAKTTVGIVGPTGSGKTTFVDLILGLLKPTHGKVLVDGNEITARDVRQWQKNIGYVPQAIYLADVSIKKNIAYGIPEHQIDMSKVRLAAQMAQIDTFITGSLPASYETVVGERGVRLSGGQRQRLGIARALYGQPELIVFDEATSALDSETESALMESINNLSGKKTIIMIAHRLETLSGADRIIKISNGKVEEIVTSELSRRKVL